MKLGMNHPMGPLALADFIGLDVCLAIMEVLHQRPRRRQVPPLPAAPPDGGRGPAGAEDRPGILRLHVLAILQALIRVHSRCFDPGSALVQRYAWASTGGRDRQ